MRAIHGGSALARASLIFRSNSACVMAPATCSTYLLEVADYVLSELEGTAKRGWRKVRRGPVK